MVIEKGERLAGFDGFKPQTDATEFRGHRVGIHTIEAVSDDIAKSTLIEKWRRLTLALCLGTYPRQMPSEPVRRTNQKVAGADRRIADLESEDGAFGFRGRLALDGLFDNGIESRVQQALHERVRRVVGTGGLALIASNCAEGEDARGEFHGGVEFEQALVDTAQLLAAQVAVVHQSPGAAVLDQCQITNR